MSGSRGWWTAVAAVAVLVGVAVTSAPSSGVPTPVVPLVPAERPLPPAEPRGAAALLVARRTADVEELLRRRADAIRRHDLAEFLDGIDPATDPRFRTAQRTMFDNLGTGPTDDMMRPELRERAAGTPDGTTGVAFAVWDYELIPGEVAAVPDPRSLPSMPDELWAPAVRLRYALAGADVVPTTRPMGYLFARRGSRWYLASDDQLAERDRATWRGPWDFAPCQESRTASGVVLSHPGGEAVAKRVAGALDGAVRAVTAVWGPDWPQQVAVVQPATLPELRVAVGSRFASDEIAGVTVADRVDRTAHRVEGARVVLNPDTTADLSDAALGVVLRHEITHVAARASTMDGSPMWLLEGFADYVGYRSSGYTVRQAAPNLARLVAAGGPPAALPSNTDFQSTGSNLDLAYQLSWSVSLFVADRAGEPALVALYRRLAAEGPATDASVDAALRSVLGIDRRTFLTDWRTYLRRTFSSA